MTVRFSSRNQSDSSSWDRFVRRQLRACARLPGRRAAFPRGRGGLLIVDPQRFFCDESSPAFLADWPQIAPRIRLLADAFRRRELPCRVSRQLGPDPGRRPAFDAFFSRPLSADSPWSALLPEWNDDRESVLIKDSFSLFAPGAPGYPGPVNWLAICGVRLDRCVLASLLGAHAAGIIPLLVADAVAAGDRKLHAAALRLVASGHGILLHSRELLRWLEKSVP